MSSPLVPWLLRLWTLVGPMVRLAAVETDAARTLVGVRVIVLAVVLTLSLLTTITTSVVVTRLVGLRLLGAVVGLVRVGVRAGIRLARGRCRRLVLIARSKLVLMLLAILELVVGLVDVDCRFVPFLERVRANVSGQI